MDKMNGKRGKRPVIRYTVTLWARRSTEMPLSSLPCTFVVCWWHSSSWLPLLVLSFIGSEVQGIWRLCRRHVRLTSYNKRCSSISGDHTASCRHNNRYCGIEADNRGRSCEEHDACGSVLEENAVVRIRHAQILVDGSEESALAVYWIADGIDRCRVGFLQRTFWSTGRRMMARLHRL
jgi:hypothetical protein